MQDYKSVYDILDINFRQNNFATLSKLEEYIKTMESTYKNYSKDVKVNFWEINNHKIGEIEFTTQASDTEIYNHIIAFSVDGKLRLVNFNCTKELEDEWKEISKFIIDSIKFA